MPWIDLVRVLIWLPLLVILKLFIFKITGLMLCSCLACLSASALTWRALATDEMGKVCPQIFRGSGWSEGSCHTSRQSPAAQWRSFRAADPPETHRGSPGSCTNVRTFKETSSCSIDLCCCISKACQRGDVVEFHWLFHFYLSETG